MIKYSIYFYPAKKHVNRNKLTKGLNTEVFSGIILMKILFGYSVHEIRAVYLDGEIILNINLIT